MSYGRPWVSERERLLKTARTRAEVALGSYSVDVLRKETERLFGCRVPNMTTRQLHLFIGWLSALNALTWARKIATRSPPL